VGPWTGSAAARRVAPLTGAVPLAGAGAAATSGPLCAPAGQAGDSPRSARPATTRLRSSRCRQSWWPTPPDGAMYRE